MYITRTKLNNSPITIDYTYVVDPIKPIWYNLATFNAGGRTLLDYSGHRNNGKILTDLDHEGLQVDTTNGGGIVLSGTQWISSPYILSQDFTVSMVVKYDPNLNNFPASLWGSEFWDNNSGYLAAFTDPSTISFGLAGDLNGYPSNAYSTVQVSLSNPQRVTMLDFAKIGTIFIVYVNGQPLGYTDFGQEGTASELPINFGSRHQNNGTDALSDPIVCSIYDITVRNYGLTAPECNLLFQGIKSRYGL